ncbi:MAG: DUF6116 family protein, partial [Gammaproteobacteria bacterium]
MRQGVTIINPIEKFLQFANRLKFRNLFLVTTFLFAFNLLIPDFIPFIDEIILGLVAIILATIRQDKQLEDKGDIIEGEVVDDEENNVFKPCRSLLFLALDGQGQFY